MAAFDDVFSGSYVADGNAKLLQIPSGVDFIEVLVQGDATGNVWSNTPPLAGRNKHSYWQAGMLPGTALVLQTTGVAGVANQAFLAADGFTPVESAANLFGPAFAGTLNNANPAVLTVPGDPYVTGDVVLLESAAGTLSKEMLGIEWSLVRTGVGTYTLNNAFDASALTAAGPVTVRELLYPFVFTPYLSYIVDLTLGATTTVTTSYPHGLSAGQTVRLIVPAPWGSTSLNGQQGLITSVVDAWTFVVAINSSAASAFAFPSVVQANQGVTWPQVIPIAEEASTFVGSFTDMNYKGIILGASIAGPAGALVIWRARHSLKVFTS